MITLNMPRLSPVMRIRIRDPVLFYPPDPGLLRLAPETIWSKKKVSFYFHSFLWMIGDLNKNWIRIWDPEWKNFGSGSATLAFSESSLI
jgi:hypothetical protein